MSSQPNLLSKHKISFFLIMITLFGGNVYAQFDKGISDRLQKIGFENVSVLVSEGTYYISLENNVYRWNVHVISYALDTISNMVDYPSDIQLVLVQKGLPYCLIKVNSKIWTDFNTGLIDEAQFTDSFELTWNTQEAWKKLKGTETFNSDRNKVDLVIYPQFSYENTRLAKIYETQFNIAPAIELSLWKGNEIRGQMIIPVHNELGYEGDFIRPGYVTISQDFKLPGQWWGKFHSGNFSNNRYGLGMYVWHPFKNENWNFEARAGLTGYSHYFEGKWNHGSLNTITWSASMSWYYSKYNLAFKGGAAQYIYNDLGLFGSVKRYFGETIVAFFIQFNEHNFNGGFNLTIPFPFKRRFKPKRLRVNIPNYFNLSYNAGSEHYYGQIFSTSPVDIQNNFVTFTKEIEGNIIKLKTSTP